MVISAGKQLARLENGGAGKKDFLSKCLFNKHGQKLSMSVETVPRKPPQLTYYATLPQLTAE